MIKGAVLNLQWCKLRVDVNKMYKIIYIYIIYVRRR